MNVLPLLVMTARESGTGTLGMKLSLRSKRTTRPLIVAKLHNALLRLGSQAAKVQVVAVSVDPKGDTPETVKAFLAAREMTGRMRYLIGSFKQLAPVWKAYGIEVQATPERREVGHTGIIYAITASGKRIALYPANFTSDWIVHDVPILASL